MLDHVKASSLDAVEIGTVVNQAMPMARLKNRVTQLPVVAWPPEYGDMLT